MSKIKNSTIQKYFKLSVKDLYENDLYLLDSSHELHEQAISHRLAVYLEKYFSHLKYYKDNGLSVDCEYNKNGEDCKRIYGICYNCNEHNCFIKKDQRQHNDIYLPLSGDNDDKAVRPDIIIHHRGDNYPTNILVIEVKKVSNPSAQQKRDDKMKLSAFTCPKSDDDKPCYHYRLGFYLEYQQTSAKVAIFENGKERSELIFEVDTHTWRTA